MVPVCFECGEFTIIRDTGYHGKPDDFGDCDHKTYTYSERKAKHQDWFSREDGEGFTYLVPELKKEPPAPGEKESATGKDMHEIIMEVAEVKGGEA